MLLDYNKCKEGEGIDCNQIENIETYRYLALKVMDGNFFNLVNHGEYLNVDITFFENRDGFSFPHYLSFDSQNRYRFPKNSIDNLYNSRWPGYSLYNIKDSDVKDGDEEDNKQSTLSVESDNFTNQTIISMIINKIMTDSNIDNYVHQYDAFLCLNTSTDASIYDQEDVDDQWAISKVIGNFYWYWYSWKKSHRGSS